MTTAEHRLILQMFTQQAHIISTLIAILESRGVLEKSDLLAYDAHQAADEVRAIELEQEVKEMYQGFAKALGVTTGLPHVI